MKIVFKYLKPYWYLALLAPIFMVGEVLMDLLQPKLMASIVNEGVIKGNIDLIVKTGLLMLGLTAIGGLAGVLSGITASIASQNFANDLRKDTFNKIMHLSFEQTDKFKTGSLVTRLTNDISSIQQLVSMSIRMFVRTGMQFIGGIYMLVKLNVSLGIVLVVALPFELIIVIVFIKKVAPVFTKIQNKLDIVNTVVQENVIGARVVKAFVNEEKEEKRFSEANYDLTETTLKVQKTMAFISPLIGLFMNLSVCAIILIGSFEAEAKTMNAGDVMAGVTYVTQILSSMLMIGMMFQTISRAKASIIRVNEILVESPVINNGEITDTLETGTIEFRNVSFSYPSLKGKPVLENINLKINKGDSIGILGATGSGKSSLVNLIPRFYDVTGGEVLVDGVNVKDFDLETLRKKISFVLQKTELFAGTIKENIMFSVDNAGAEDIIDAAKTAQAHDFILSFEKGYETIVGEKGASLSGGQKQRIALARAILKKPEILIFDDSTSALDLKTEAKFYKELNSKTKDITKIIIAQRVATVKNASKIVIIDNGEIIDIGSHNELIKTSILYQDIYNSQLKKEDVING